MVESLATNTGSLSYPVSDIRRFVLRLLPESRERLSETHVVAGSMWIGDGAIGGWFDTWLSISLSPFKIKLQQALNDAYPEMHHRPDILDIFRMSFVRVRPPHIFPLMFRQPRLARTVLPAQAFSHTSYFSFIRVTFNTTVFC